MNRHTLFFVVAILLLGTCGLAVADWLSFRGPGVRGRSTETDLAVTWSETENLAWKTPLPGPGSSSPIVVGDRVFVTCYSGYGLDRENPGDPNQLQRHLVCLSATDGDILWNKSVPSQAQEDPYNGWLREHGYASSTPVSDGQHVYTFFGKSGVYAFTLAGQQLWQASVGTDSDQMKWGSASSPVLYDNLLIVNAWDESKTLYALNKRTGQEVWKKDLSQTGLTYATPVPVTVNDHVELVFVAPTQVWGLHPETGEQLWAANSTMKDNIINSPVVVGEIAYVHGGGPSSRNSMAVRLGARGNVTDTHVLWTGKEAASVSSPVVVGAHAYWADASGKVVCQDVKTGETVYSEDLPAAGQFAVYASLLHAQDKLYAVTRKGGVFVLPARPEFEILAHNTFASDNSDFNGSPAVSNGKIFLRSNHALYCVASTDQNGWISLFDGQTLNGWRASENKDTFSVKDGMIVAHGPRSHLFYTGPVADADFTNFAWQADIKTEPGSNSGMYFHTEYQETGWPDKGYEVQVNNSHSDWRRTGGLYAVDDVRESPAKDNEWFTQLIIVKDKRITVLVNGKLTVDYTEPEEVSQNGHPTMPGRKLSHGTLALQGHDPDSVVYYRNIKVKPLP